MSAKINIRHMEGVTVLEVSGRIVLGEGGIVFRDSFQDVLKAGTQKVVVDLGGVTYMDSSGLGELTNAYTSAKARGCDVKLGSSHQEARRPDADYQAGHSIRHLLRRGRSSRLFLQLPTSSCVECFAEQARPMDVLMPCYSDSEGQHRISLEREITSIGRSPNQDIVMSDLNISRNHAVIACAPYLNCDEILEKVAKFSATNPAQDDCTLLELKYMRDASILAKSRFNQPSESPAAELDSSQHRARRFLVPGLWTDTDRERSRDGNGEDR